MPSAEPGCPVPAGSGPRAPQQPKEHLTQFQPAPVLIYLIPFVALSSLCLTNSAFFFFFLVLYLIAAILSLFSPISPPSPFASCSPLTCSLGFPSRLISSQTQLKFRGLQRDFLALRPFFQAGDPLISQHAGNMGDPGTVVMLLVLGVAAGPARCQQAPRADLGQVGLCCHPPAPCPGVSMGSFCVPGSCCGAGCGCCSLLSPPRAGLCLLVPCL